jgi:hypothetical protein
VTFILLKILITIDDNSIRYESIQLNINLNIIHHVISMNDVNHTISVDIIKV